MKKYKYIILALIALSIACNEPDSREDFEQKKNAAINNLIENDTTVYSVEEAMKTHGLNGLSVAVFENYEIAWTAQWGVKDVSHPEMIDEQTAFSTASISKAVTATLFAILEEKGLIDLKSSVSSYLKRWKLPDNKFFEEKELTFEHLLSHTAGSTQGGFADFYKGDTLPTLVESLEGKIPNYDREIEFTAPLGGNWKYSGGAYVIAQMAVEDYLNKSLADLANEHLFQPLSLKRTTMKQPNEDGFLNNVAKAHNEKGEKIRTGIPITPQVAPSGLWSTPSDMAVLLIEMQNALRNKGKVISQRVAKRVTEIVTSKVMGGWSLGWERRHGYGNYEWFSHGGANTGTGGYIYATMEDGNGIAFFGNGANSNRIPVLDQFRNSIIKAHNWYKPLDKSAQLPLPNQLKNQLVGVYEDIIFGDKKEVFFRDGKLILSPYFNENRELIFIGNNTFIIDEFTHMFKFEINPTDGLMHIATIRKGTGEKEFAYRKIAD